MRLLLTLRLLLLLLSAVFIAVPADDGDVPNLLPEQNRMTWNTFMQVHEKKTHLFLF